MNDFYNPKTKVQSDPHAGRSPMSGAPRCWPKRARWHCYVAASRTAQLARNATRSAKNGLEAAPEPPYEIDGAAPGELPSLLARSSSGIRSSTRRLISWPPGTDCGTWWSVIARPDKPQIFRLGRAPLGAEGGPLPPHLGAALTGHEGLYADPPIVGPVAAACVTSLVELALRLDLLVHDASHDSLTGLLNRRSYELLLSQAVSRARRYGWPFALVLLDLDNFKVVNDHVRPRRRRHGPSSGGRRAPGLLAQRRRGRPPGWGRVRTARRGSGQRRCPLAFAGAPEESTGTFGAADERLAFPSGWRASPPDTDDPNALTGLADARLYAAKAAMECR